MATALGSYFLLAVLLSRLVTITTRVVEPRPHQIFRSNKQSVPMYPRSGFSNLSGVWNTRIKALHLLVRIYRVPSDIMLRDAISKACNTIRKLMAADWRDYGRRRHDDENHPHAPGRNFKPRQFHSSCHPQLEW